jgi:hypothetical protein
MANHLIPFTEQEVSDLMEAIDVAVGASVHDSERQRWAVLYERLESWLLTLFPDIPRNPMQITETAEQTAFRFLKDFLRDDQGLVEEWRSEADQRYSLTLQLCHSYMDKIESDAKVIAALREANQRLGSWMAAALDDPQVCAEMKADITAWFAAMTSDMSPMPHRTK